jgi:serine/threonine protein kinase
LNDEAQKSGKFPVMDIDLAFNIFYQIVLGMSVLFDMGIVHGDIKPANIFINEGLIKIGDLGMATQEAK